MKRVAVTGGGGQIAYSLLFRIAHGDVFGAKERVSLHIRDLPEMRNVLEGLAMELEDAAFPLLAEIKIGSDPDELFDEVDAAFLVGAKPRGPGMERGDLLVENAKIFVDEGKALERVASRDVRVLVVGNPCNTNCLIALSQTKRLNPHNFHAMMRLDENRSRALLAKKAGVPVTEVTNMTIWGNHSATQVPDFTNAKIGGERVDALIDRDYLQGEFLTTVQKRGATIIAARGKSSAASAASAAIDAMRALVTPTHAGSWFSSACLSDGNPYGIEPGLIFGFPCRINAQGELEIVPDLPWDLFLREKIAATQKELIEERSCIAHLLGDKR